MTLTEKLQGLGTEFKELGVQCSHYWREVKNPPLMIWQETGADSFRADNRTGEQLLTGTVDYFTLTEYDTNIDGIQSFLQNKMKYWDLDSIQYEEETNLIHYQWTWSF